MDQRTNIRQYHTISWGFTIGFCILLVIYTEAVRVPAVLHSLLLCATLMIPRVSHFFLPRRNILSWVQGAIVILLTTSEITQVANFNDVASLMVEVIIGFLPITLMHREKEVSYWLSLLNTTIIAIGCMLFKGDIFVYLVLLGFLSTILFNLNSANMFLLSKGEPEQQQGLPLGFFRQFWTTIPIGILTGAIIFVAFPRVKNLNFAIRGGDGNNRTGYTGSVDLEGGRPIDQSEALAFTIVSNDRDWLKSEGWNLLFRGTSLAIFDGKKWLPTAAEKVPFNNQDLRINQKHETYTKQLQVFMEPTNEDALFYTGSLFSFNQMPKNVGSILVDEYGNVTRADTSKIRYSYEIQTFVPNDIKTLPKKSLAEMSKDSEKSIKKNRLPYSLDQETFEVYTNVPDSLKKEDWFEAWVKSVNIDVRKNTASEAMRLLKNHFQTNFEASLINQFSSADSFKSFITTDKRGHCEYFSTAATVLFRQLGIPARMVLGYRGGRYNAVSQTLEVREESAHAWVEIFVSGTGWISYDPTPLAPPTMSSSSNSFITDYITAAQFWFNRYVIDYDRGTQQNLVESIQNLGYKKGTDQWSTFEWFKQVSMPVLVGTGAIVLILLGLRFVRFKKRWTNIPTYYRLYLSTMRKKGFERQKGESIRLFHQRIAQAAPNGELHLEIARAIEIDLYSQVPNTDSVKIDLIKRIKSAPKAG